MEIQGKDGTTNNAVTTAAASTPRKRDIKKRGGLNALWAAILLQFKSQGSKKGIQSPKNKEATTESPDKNETTWKNIVGGIRPLHLHPLENRLSVSLLPPPPPPPFGNEVYHDVSLPPQSPQHSCDGMSSRYCSVEDLQALDSSGEEGEIAAEEGGSDVINTQAEEFIAKFYEQIRLQRLQSLNENS